MTETTAPGITQSAAALMQQGRPDDALKLLEKGAESGDLRATLLLAQLFLNGRPFGRDLNRSRRWFHHGADLGDTDSLKILAAFMANGTGAPKDWPGALQLLRDHSDTGDFECQIALIKAMNLDDTGAPETVPKGEEVEEFYGARRFRNFLSPDECDYLISTATPLLAPSTVIDDVTGDHIADPIRRSDVAYFPLMSERPIIHAINMRIAAASDTDVAQGEPLQILRYVPGQEYRRHADAIPFADNQRVTTFLIYLNDDYSGGETEFPEMNLVIRGNRGDAFMFPNVDDLGQPAARTEHLGRPVSDGSKFLASRWIRAMPLDLTA